MLTCVYHALGNMIVVEDDEAQRLFDTGVWFNSPKTAREYKAKVEQDILNEKAQEKLQLAKLNDRIKDKVKGKKNER